MLVVLCRGPLVALVFLSMVVLPVDRGFPVAQAAVQDGGEGAQLLELAERLLARTIGTGGARDAVQLLPGRLADELPFALPTPPGARLVGSLVRSADPNGTSVEVVMDAPGSPAEVVALFDQVMPEQGWSPPPTGSPGRFVPGGPSFGGFQTPEQAGRLAARGGTYCREPNGAFLTVTVTPRESGPNDLRAKLQFPPRSTGVGYGACAVLQPVLPPGPGNIAPGPNLIPRLTLPEGVTLDQPSVRGLGATGPGSYGTEITVTATFSVVELEAYFDAQLSALGWTRLTGSAGDLVAWSIWQLPREDMWQGTLVVLQRPGEERRTLMVRVDSLSDPATFAPGAGTATVVPREPVTDVALLRELAERLLADPYGSGTVSPTLPTLLVGQLPPDLELALSLPSGTRLLGSIVRPSDERNPVSGSEIVLDVPGDPREIRAWLTDALGGGGWTRPPYASSGGSAGFVSAFSPLAASFCQEESGNLLNFSMRLQAGGMSDVRVTRQAGTLPCWPPLESFSRFGPPPNASIPALVADREAEVYPGSMQIGASGFGSNAMIITAASTDQLAAAFQQQLAEAGWTAVGAEASGSLAWSMWDVPGEGTWHGMLLVFDLPGENRHALLLRVDQVSGGAAPRGE